MANTVHLAALDGVQATIQALTLAGIWTSGNLPSSQVIVRKLTSDVGVASRAALITVSTGGDPEEDEEVTTGSTVWRYPCKVDLETADNENLALDNARLTVRRQLRQAFHRQRPQPLVTALFVQLGVPFLDCLWEPSPVVEPSAFRQANLGLSSMLVWVRTVEQNGS